MDGSSDIPYEPDLRNSIHALPVAEVSETVEKCRPPAGRTIAELGVSKEFVITAVMRKGKRIILHGDQVLLPDDEVLSVLHSAPIALLAVIFGPVKGMRDSRQT
jgi:Trk K+ transport system NAD-binding subunit